jgi:receptor protein-tyrosine kinase
VEIKEYLRIFGRYWWMIVVCTIIGAAVGWGTWQFTDREYQSTATLFVATQNGTTVTEAYQNNLFSQDRAGSYAGLATSEQVAARAVDQLKAPITAEELRSKITAVATPKTVLLNVGVTDPDPAQAQTYANAVADQLVGLVSELETSRRGGSPAAGLVVVDEADYPTTPLGWGMLLRIGIGAGSGLAAGILVAILIGLIDRRLRSKDAIEGAVDSVVIGTLPKDSAREKVDVVDLAQGGLYAERIRELRTNLRFASSAKPQGPARVIAVTSPSAEDGRTTTAIDLAAALAESGRSVVLVDGDLRNPALTDRLPLINQMRDAALAKGLSTVLSGEHNMAESIISDVILGANRVALLPAGPDAPRPGQLWASDRAGRVFADLTHGFDYVVVDTPPLNDFNDAAVVAALADGALLLARIRHTTGAALRRAKQALESASVAILGTVVTFEPGHRGDQRRERSAGPGAGAQPANVDREQEEDEADTTVVPQNGLVGSASAQRRARHGFS